MREYCFCTYDFARKAVTPACILPGSHDSHSHSTTVSSQSEQVHSRDTGTCHGVFKCMHSVQGTAWCPLTSMIKDPLDTRHSQASHL